MRWTAVVAVLAALAAQPPQAPAAPPGPGGLPSPPSYVVDDFENLALWSAHPADGTTLAIRPDAGAHGQAMRLDFDFVKGGGYVIARRNLDLTLPENYVFSFSLKGDAPSEQLEFKLVDSTGANVWWSVRRDVTWPRDWKTFRIKKRQISFAWGPAGGGTIEKPAALEIAITAGSGGKGSVWIDDLALTPLPPPDAVPPVPVLSASSAQPGAEAPFAADGDTATSWSPNPSDPAPWLALDFRTLREFGGLTLRWAYGEPATDYDVETSEDGVAWTMLRAVRGSNGGRDDIYLPDSEARHVRVHVRRAPGTVALEEVVVRPLEWSSSRSAFFESIAKDAQRGFYPRSLIGEQVYWTVVGVDGAAQNGLLSEDGAYEVGRGAFSIEPFLYLEGKLVTWADVEESQALADGYLPIPSVAWRAGDTRLTVEAIATGDEKASATILRYVLSCPNAGVPVRGRLYLAVRPFQVNPPTQFLNMSGGAARITSISRAGDVVSVDGRRVVSLVPLESFGAMAYDSGDIVADLLSTGALPAGEAVVDSFGAASATLSYAFDMAPDHPDEVDVVVPFDDAYSVPQFASADSARSWTAARRAGAVAAWTDTLGVAANAKGDSAAVRVMKVMKSQLAYTLVSRSGPSLRPGTRSYARSWIRDGALDAESLLRLGHPEAVRAFIEWYAPYQYADGKIPCVVDDRGADPVPENDSNGEFIFLVAEYYRDTGDRKLAESMWPHVARAAAYLDSLRQLRRTDEYRAPDKREFFGLLPESISHEGYSAKPMHSYWDDFFAARGFRDAAFLARELGHGNDARRIEGWRDEFEHDLRASIEAAMAAHSIDYIPGCADLGDFDATSTAIGVSPLGLEDILPHEALERTFDRYMTFFRARRDGAPWDAFTPYEARIIGALVRLGRRDEAQELLDYFLRFLRPEAWNVWAEVVGKDARTPRFIGDMPHTWVGMEFARSVLDMFAYFTAGDSTLVLGAGIPESWANAPRGFRVDDLPVGRGTLSLSASPSSAGLVVRVSGKITMPRGGVFVRSPLEGTTAATVDGKAGELDPTGAVRTASVPAEIVFSR